MRQSGEALARKTSLGRWRARLVIAGIVVLAGCGGGGSDDEGTPGPSPATTIAGPDGATLTLPEGALASPAPTVRIAKDATAAPPLPAVFAAAGDVFAVSPDAAALQVVGTLRIPVDPSTAEDTPVAIAETNDSGGWTLRTDARIDGTMLEIGITRLGHFRVVKPASGLASAAQGRSGRVQPARFVPWSTGIALGAPGFAPADVPDGAGGTVKLLQKTTPFVAVGSVAASAQAFGSVFFCPEASAIDVEYQSNAPSFAIPAGSVRQPIAPASGGPWTFDVRVFKPIDLPYTSMSAAVTVQCTDLLGGSYAVRAERTIRYTLDPTIGGLVLSAPGFTAVGTPPAARRLRADSPFASPAAVPLTLELASATSEAARCAIGRSVLVEYFPASTGNRFLPLQTLEVPLSPPGAAPWTFDLRVFQVEPSIAGTWARVTLQCDDSTGAPLAITAEQYVEFFANAGTGLAIFSHPADATAVVGQSASFQVSVSGGPSPPRDLDRYVLYWEQSRDGGATRQTVGIAYQTDVPAGAAGEGRLHAFSFGPLTAADNGSLLRARVCYTPSAGSEQCVQSRDAQLTVVQGLVAPQIARQPRHAATLVGQTASFDLAFSGTPTPLVRWQLLSSDATAWLDIGTAAAWPGSVGNAATLVTPAGTLADNGSVLRAVVANLGGEVASDPVVWRVTTTPIPTSITLQPADARTVLGGSATFAGLADGTAPLSYQWSRGGSPIAGATGPVLSIANVQAADLASYQLTVSGPGGSATSRAASLTVASAPPAPTPPQIVQQPQPRTVSVGGSAAFAVVVAGDPAPACQWTRNGVAIAGATSCSSYSTSAAAAVDNGAVFNVVAYNAGGAVFAGGAVLTVQGAAPQGWTVLPTQTGTLLYDVAVVVPRDVVVAVGFDGRIRRSSDGGAHWNVVYQPSDSSRYLLKVRFADASVGVAVGPRVILRTVDGGASWQPAWTQEVEGDPVGPNQFLQAVDWIGADTAVAVGLSRVWISVDRGATWQPHGSADFSALGIGTVHALRFADAQTAYAASDYRMLRTQDGGLSWQEIAAGTFTDPVYGVETGGAGEVVAVGGSGIYRSLDAGATWTRLTAATFLGLERAYLIGLKGRGREMVAVGEDGLVISTLDAGYGWTVEPALPFGQLWGVDFVAGNAVRPIYAVGLGGVAARLD